MYVKPAPGKQVRMPYPPYEYMPEAGGNVPMTPYWARRLARHDVVFADDLEQPQSKKKVKE